MDFIQTFVMILDVINEYHTNSYICGSFSKIIYDADVELIDDVHPWKSSLSVLKQDDTVSQDINKYGILTFSPGCHRTYTVSY